jgi:hypothetical protein
MKTLSGLKKRKSLKLPLLGSPRRGQPGDENEEISVIHLGDYDVTVV